MEHPDCIYYNEGRCFADSEAARCEDICNSCTSYKVRELSEVQEAFSTVECFATHGGINSDCCQRCGKHTFDDRFDALMKVRNYIYGDRLATLEDCAEKVGDADYIKELVDEELWNAQ